MSTRFAELMAISATQTKESDVTTKAKIEEKRRKEEQRKKELEEKERREREFQARLVKRRMEEQLRGEERKKKAEEEEQARQEEERVRVEKERLESEARAQAEAQAQSSDTDAEMADGTAGQEQPSTSVAKFRYPAIAFKRPFEDVPPPISVRHITRRTCCAGGGEAEAGQGAGVDSTACFVWLN